MVNLYVRVMPSGYRSLVVVARDIHDRQRWITIGCCDHLTVETARTRARTIISRIKAGKWERLTAENARLRDRIQRVLAALAGMAAE